MGDADELLSKPVGVELVEREAQHQPVPVVRLADRKPQRHDVELAGEVLDGAVVHGDVADTERRLAGPRPEPGDDVLSGAKSRGFHEAGV